jgi:hypothetical protein
MPLRRQIFEVDTDTGTWTDTGPSFHGAIQQMAWNPDTVDTGADLSIWLIPKNGDTGDNILVYSEIDCLGADFLRVPLQPGHSPDGSDTGVDQYFPIVSAGERLRIRVTPGGAAVSGRLYIWSYTG